MAAPKGNLRSPPPAAERKGWLKDGWPALAILAATVLFYVPALQGGFLWDDDTYISNEASLRTWQGLGQIWFVPGATEQYYPLSFTVFWLEYHLWGLNTLGYHLVTVLLHGMAAVLLWQVLARLRVRGALLAGAIFALHPVNVMSVAWMTELKNTLSGVFVLGACWAYLRFAGVGVYENRAAKPAWRCYVVALALFLLAMLAKTGVSFFPATLLLILWWQKKKVTARDVLWLVPMAGITFGMGALTIYVEQHSGGASGPDFQLGFVERVLVSGRSFWFYLGKLLFPYDLTFIYPRWQIEAGAWWQYLYPLATAGLLAGLWLLRDRVGKGVWVAFMHFYMTTSMLILIVVIYMTRYSFVSDHWQYFGAMGMLGLFGAAITAGLDRLGLEGRPVGLGLKLGLLAGLGVLTWRQCGMYADIETLWRTTIARNPDCWMARNNLGNVLQQTGRSSEAMDQYEQILRVKPDDAEAHINLGDALLQARQLSEAMEQFEEALRIKPDSASAHNNLGDALLRSGRVSEAMAQFEQALRIKPNYAEAHDNLGNALLQIGRVSEAIEQYQEALSIRPDDAEVHNNLGNVLFQTGRVSEAMEQYEQALRSKPDYAEARNNLGYALLQTGRASEALDQFEEALRIKPDYGEAHNNLGLALVAAGRVPEAIEQYEQALRNQPDYASAHNNLGNALQDAGRLPEAIEQY
jgi:tetratricopeptide (TPR) repeat protein